MTKISMLIVSLHAFVLSASAQNTNPDKVIGKWQSEAKYLNIENSEIRVYSGTSLGITAPTQNETPTTIVDFNLAVGHEVAQEIPTSYNGFIYVIAGTVKVGDEKTVVGEQQVTWLDKPNEKANSQIKFRGGENGGRFIFYAGEPQGASIVSQGPFIADTKEDIVRLYHEYSQGEMGHVHDLPEKQVMSHA